MGLFSKNQNRHGLIGKKQNMFEKCCNEEPEDCCDPIPPCTCSFDQFLFNNGQYIPFIDNTSIGEITMQGEDFVFYIALENTGTCYFDIETIVLDVTPASASPILLELVDGEGFYPGTRKPFVMVTIPADVDPNVYEFVLSFTFCNGTRGSISFSFEILWPVQYQMRVSFHNLIDLGGGTYDIGSEILGNTIYNFDAAEPITNVFSIGNHVFTKDALQAAIVWITPTVDTTFIGTVNNNVGYTPVLGTETGLPMLFEAVNGEQVFEIYIADTSVSGSQVTFDLTLETSTGVDSKVTANQDVYTEDSYRIEMYSYEVIETSPGDYTVQNTGTLQHNKIQPGDGSDSILGGPIAVNVGNETVVVARAFALHPAGVSLTNFTPTGSLTLVSSSAMAINSADTLFNIVYGNPVYIAMIYFDNYNVPGLNLASATINIDGGAPAGPYETEFELTHTVA